MFNFLRDSHQSGQWFNQYYEPSNEYTPVQSGRLANHKLRQVQANDPHFPKIISMWQGTVDTNDTNVYIRNTRKDQNDPSLSPLKDKAYFFFYETLQWDSVAKKIINFIVREGGCILNFDPKENTIKVYSQSMFNVYHNKYTQETRYKLLVDGAEQGGFLHHGEDLWHIKDWAFTDWIVAPSRIETVYSWLLLEQKGIQVNANIFAKGMIGSLIFKFKDELYKDPKLTQEITENGAKTTGFEKIFKRFRDKFVGASNSNKVGASTIPYLDNILEPGKSNTDLQFDKLLDHAVQAKLTTYGLSKSDFGLDNTTYNNAEQYGYQRHENIGQHLHNILDDCRNNYILKLSGLKNTIKIYYNPYLDPNKLAKDKSWLEDWKNGVITKNEYREMRGLDSIEGGDDFIAQIVTDEKPDKEESEEADFAEKKKTPSSKALRSKAAKKFKARVAKAVQKKIEAFDGEKSPKLETFYPFDVLEKDLTAIAKVGAKLYLKEVGKTKFIDLPDILSKALTSRVVWLLKGGKKVKKNSEMLPKDYEEYGGLDVAIDEMIFDNKDDLGDLAAEMAATKANEIMTNEVVANVERTRALMYKEDGATHKKWDHVNDSRVRSKHRDNQAQGKIEIDEEWASGEDDPADSFGCRCSVNYYFD